jgi:hypothetical protein
MSQSQGPSWQITIDEPEDLHLALYVRDAAGLDVDAVPGVPGPLARGPRSRLAVPEAELTGVLLDWGQWWRAIVNARQATGVGRPGDAAAAGRRSRHRAIVGSPPHFEGLAHAPALRALVTEVYTTRFAAWWQGARPDPLENEQELFDHDTIGGPLWRHDGVRGDLLAALRSPSFIPHEVVASIRDEKNRPLAPFSLMVNVMATIDTSPTMVAADYALVPVGIYREPALYRAWLRTVVRAIA